jgi:hypothetical protein
MDSPYVAPAPKTSTWLPEEEDPNYFTGQPLSEEDKKRMGFWSSENPDVKQNYSYVGKIPQGQQWKDEISGKNYYEKNGEHFWMPETGSTGYDPEKGFYAQGGELKGEIIWDVQNKRFKKMPAFFALNGLETSLDSMLKKDASKINYTEGFDAVQQKSGLNWDVLADSTYGMASNINEKKRLLNSLTSSDQAAEARAGIFNAVTPASGGEGVYNALTGQFIADRTGNQVRPGTGTDQTVYGTGAANNVYEDLNPGGVNLFSRNGGILNYAQNGIEINQEYDLSDEDMNELAPYLKKLGLKLEML